MSLAFLLAALLSLMALWLALAFPTFYCRLPLLMRFCPDQGTVFEVVWGRLLGVVLLALVPYLLSRTTDLGPQRLGLHASLGAWGWGWSLVALVVVPLLNIKRVPTEANLRFNPYMRVPRWTPPLIALSSITWIFYLVAYEYFFRGILLDTLQQLWGWPIALVLQMAIYPLSHLHQVKEMRIGSIFFGGFLGLVAYQTGSFLTPLIIHLVLAMSTEWMTIAHLLKQQRVASTLAVAG